jgi:hypothetical protein
VYHDVSKGIDALSKKKGGAITGNFCNDSRALWIKDIMKEFYEEYAKCYKIERQNEFESFTGQINLNQNGFNSSLLKIITDFHNALIKLKTNTQSTNNNTIISAPTPTQVISPVTEPVRETSSNRQSIGPADIKPIEKPAITERNQELNKVDQVIKQKEEEKMEEQQIEATAESQKIDESLQLNLKQELQFGGSDDNFGSALFGNLFNLLQKVTSEQQNVSEDNTSIIDTGYQKLEGLDDIKEKCKKLSNKWKMDGQRVIPTNKEDPPTADEIVIINKYCKNPNFLYKIIEKILNFALIDLKNILSRIAGGVAGTVPGSGYIGAFVKSTVAQTVDATVQGYLLYFISKLNNLIINMNDDNLNTLSGKLLILTTYYINNITKNTLTQNFDPTSGGNWLAYAMQLSKTIDSYNSIIEGKMKKSDIEVENIFGYLDIGAQDDIFQTIATIDFTKIITQTDIDKYDQLTFDNCDQIRNLSIGSMFVGLQRNEFENIKKIILCKTINNTDITVTTLINSISNLTGIFENIVYLYGDILKFSLTKPGIKTIALDNFYGTDDTDITHQKKNVFRRGINNNLESIGDNVSEIENEINKYIDYILNKNSNGSTLNTMVITGDLWQKTDNKFSLFHDNFCKFIKLSQPNNKTNIKVFDETNSHFIKIYTTCSQNPINYKNLIDLMDEWWKSDNKFTKDFETMCAIPENVQFKTELDDYINLLKNNYEKRSSLLTPETLINNSIPWFDGIINVFNTGGVFINSSELLYKYYKKIVDSGKPPNHIYETTDKEMLFVGRDLYKPYLKKEVPFLSKTNFLSNNQIDGDNYSEYLQREIIINGEKYYVSEMFLVFFKETYNIQNEDTFIKELIQNYKYKEKNKNKGLFTEGYNYLTNYVLSFFELFDLKSPPFDNLTFKQSEYFKTIYKDISEGKTIDINFAINELKIPEKFIPVSPYNARGFDIKSNLIKATVSDTSLKQKNVQYYFSIKDIHKKLETLHLFRSENKNLLYVDKIRDYINASDNDKPSILKQVIQNIEYLLYTADPDSRNRDQTLYIARKEFFDNELPNLIEDNIYYLEIEYDKNDISDSDILKIT